VTCPMTQAGFGALGFGIISATFQNPRFLDRDLTTTKVKDFTSETQSPNSSDTQRQQKQITEHNLKKIPKIPAQRAHNLSHRLPKATEIIHTETTPTRQQTKVFTLRTQIKSAQLRHILERLPNHADTSQANTKTSKNRKTFKLK